MKPCPFCGELIQEEAKVCKHCKSALVKTCPFCAEEISAAAAKCKHCGSDLAKKPEEKVEKRPKFISAYIGFEKSTIFQFVSCLITCGIYWYIVLYSVGQDIRQHYLKSKINPDIDVLIIIIGILVTGVLSGLIILLPFGIIVGVATLVYFVYTIYRYARDAYTMAVEENMPATDQTVLCIVLAVLCGILAPIIIQHELNKHWQLHERKT